MRLLLALLALAACSPEAPPRGPAEAPAPPNAAPARSPASIGGQWRLTEMNGRPADAVRVGDIGPITLTVGESSLRAQSQCVAFWRSYEQQGERLIVTALNPGAMCARGLTEWETEFDRTLSNVTAAGRTGDLLRLTGPGATLVFEPAPSLPRERFTGRWRLHALHGEPPPNEGPPIEITVTDDRITANTCVFSPWRYSQQGSHLDVSGVPTAVCERALSDFEKRFGAFMDGVIRATVLEDGDLILDSAPEQAQFRRVG